MPKKAKTKKVRIHSSGGNIDEGAVVRTTTSLSGWGGQTPTPGASRADSIPTPAPVPGHTPSSALAPSPAPTTVTTPIPPTPAEEPPMGLGTSQALKAGTAAHLAMKQAVKQIRLEGLNGDEFLTEEMLEDEMVHAVAKNFPIFSIGRDGVSRAVVTFLQPPPSKPLTLCFQFPSTALNHRYILALCKTVLQPDPLSHVVSIQYVDRNVRHGARGMENRWLITVNREEGRDRILEAGFHIFNKNIELQRYDDVLAEEYKEFTDYIAAQTRMYVNEKMSTLKNRKFALPSIPKEEGGGEGGEGGEGEAGGKVPGEDAGEGQGDNPDSGEKKMEVLAEVTEEEEKKG